MIGATTRITWRIHRTATALTLLLLWLVVLTPTTIRLSLRLTITFRAHGVFTTAIAILLRIGRATLTIPLWLFPTWRIHWSTSSFTLPLHLRATLRFT